MQDDGAQQSDASLSELRGTPSAEQMVQDNIGWMLALAQRVLGERALAEDAVQDAFQNAFRALDGFQERASLKTWLHRIMVNASLTILRRRKRLAEEPIDHYLPEFDQHGCRDDELPQRQRTIFELHIRLCRECRDYLAAYRRTTELSRAVMLSPSDRVADDVPQDLIEAVLKSLK